MISMALVFILDSVNGRLTQLNIIQINTERDGGGARCPGGGLGVCVTPPTNRFRTEESARASEPTGEESLQLSQYRRYGIQ